jgi:hypothetical protein
MSEPERITTLPKDLGAVERFVERCAKAAWESDT